MTFDKILAEPFNLISIEQSNGGGGNTDLQSYLVSPDGNIEFPVLGTVYVENLTTWINDMIHDSSVFPTQNGMIIPHFLLY